MEQSKENDIGELDEELVRQWENLVKEEEKRKFLLKLQRKFHKTLKMAVKSILKVYSDETCDYLLRILHKDNSTSILFEEHCRGGDMKNYIETMADIYIDGFSDDDDEDCYEDNPPRKFIRGTRL